MNKFRFHFLIVALCSAVVLTSCDDEDPPLPENKVTFQSSSQGLGADATEATVNFTLVREADADGSIVIAFTPTGVEYGTDFTTEPAATDNKITIPIAAGATTGSFKVIKTNTTGLEGDEKVVFTIESVGDGLTLGEAGTFTLSFSEIIATSATMQVEGGGTNGQNRVFIDLSGNTQTAVARSTWDLAFASAADQYRVVLNSSNKMLAYQLDKNDLTDVTEDDTLDLGARLDTDAIFGAIMGPPPSWIPETTGWMDDVSGDLTKTAIAEISGDEAHNHVYIINRGYDADNAPLGWLKIRVLRDGDGYAIQYADISSGTFKTEVISKNADHNFTYFSFNTDGEVDVEPTKGAWDIAWTGFTNITRSNRTDPDAPFIPYYNQDIILTNIHGGAKAFVYTTGTVGNDGVTGDRTYDTFTEADLSVITDYATSQLAIGASWRALNPPPAGAALNTNVFYIIEDADGNVYKLQFTKLSSDTGERGKPEFRFELLVKGS